MKDIYSLNIQNFHNSLLEKLSNPIKGMQRRHVDVNNAMAV
jgi:hypothetical protein